MKKIFLALLLLTLVIFSCKKEKCTVPFDLGNSTFKGTYTITNPTSSQVSFSFFSDGKLTITFLPSTNFYGYWNKSPNSNTVNFYFDETVTSPPNAAKGSGTLNAENNKITGTFYKISTPNIIYNYTIDKQ